MRFELSVCHRSPMETYVYIENLYENLYIYQILKRVQISKTVLNINSTNVILGLTIKKTTFLRNFEFLHIHTVCTITTVDSQNFKESNL